MKLNGVCFPGAHRCILAARLMSSSNQYEEFKSQTVQLADGIQSDSYASLAVRSVKGPKGPWLPSSLKALYCSLHPSPDMMEPVKAIKASFCNELRCGSLDGDSVEGGKRASPTELGTRKAGLHAPLKDSWLSGDPEFSAWLDLQIASLVESTLLSQTDSFQEEKASATEDGLEELVVGMQRIFPEAGGPPPPYSDVTILLQGDGDATPLRLSSHRY